MTPRPLRAPLPPLPLETTPHNMNNTSPISSPTPLFLTGASKAEQQSGSMQVDRDGSGVTEPDTSAAYEDTHISADHANDIEYGLIPLMEYRQPDLISQEIRVRFSLSYLEELIQTQGTHSDYWPGH